MRKLTLTLFVTLIFSNVGFLYGQRSAQIKAIKTYSKKILTDSTKREVTIKESDFGERRGFLIGYFLSDSLVQISWINAHASIYQNDYFFKDDQFISSRYSKRTSGYKGKNYNFEKQYCHIDGKMLMIINYKIIRTKKSTKEDILKTAIEYKELIVQANKKQQ